MESVCHKNSRPWPCKANWDDQLGANIAPLMVSVPLPGIRDLQSGVDAIREWFMHTYPGGEGSSITVIMFPGAGKTRVAQEVCVPLLRILRILTTASAMTCQGRYFLGQQSTHHSTAVWT